MIDVRNPSDGFEALRTRINTLGPPADSDRGKDGAPLTMGEWPPLIDDIVAHPQDNTDGLWNLATPEENDLEYDAIFAGSGASGWFGSAHMRAGGSRQLTIDAWPFPGGSCPHQACVPHHLFSECAREFGLARHLQGRCGTRRSMTSKRASGSPERQVPPSRSPRSPGHPLVLDGGMSAREKRPVTTEL
jgi:hypothetical protein